MDDPQAVIWSAATKLKMKRKDLAQHLGISVSAINYKFAGRNPWSLEDVTRLNKILPPSSRIILAPAELLNFPNADETAVRGSVSTKSTKMDVAKRRFKVWVLKYELDRPNAQIAKDLGFSLSSINGDIAALKKGYDPIAILANYSVDTSELRVTLSSKLNPTSDTTSLFEFNEMPRAVAQ